MNNDVVCYTFGKIIANPDISSYKAVADGTTTEIILLFIVIAFFAGLNIASEYYETKYKTILDKHRNQNKNYIYK